MRVNSEVSPNGNNGKREQEKKHVLGGQKEGLTYLERAEERFVHVHHGARVIKLAAIVRRREDRNELTVREELITILDDLSQYKVRLHARNLRWGFPQRKSRRDTWDADDVSHVYNADAETRGI
jgi:hypothetical protein